MMEQLRALDLHYADVEARLSAPETYEDPALVARLNKEQTQLQPLVDTYRAYLRTQEEREQAQAALDALTERWVYLHDLHERMEAEQRNG